MPELQILLAGWIVLVALAASLAAWVHRKYRL